MANISIKEQKLHYVTDWWRIEKIRPDPFIIRRYVLFNFESEVSSFLDIIASFLHKKYIYKTTFIWSYKF